MTFSPGADVGGSGAKRRGRSTAIVGGGAVGLVAIAVLLLNAFTGVDLSGLLGGAPGGSPQGGGAASAIAECETGADANANDDCRMAAGSIVVNQFWQERVEGYREPSLIIVEGTTSTPCGTASNAVGPFYCPSDEGVYIDPDFFAVMRQQLGASANELAQLYVLAHEYGHHVQYLVGIMEAFPNNGAGEASNGVRTELQADCYAGAWVGAMTELTDANGTPYLLPPSQQQLDDALNATASIGDDHIQAQSGMVNPETWTHGSSEQRARWFTRGYEGDVGACDTFAAAARDL